MISKITFVIITTILITLTTPKMVRNLDVDGRFTSFTIDLSFLVKKNTEKFVQLLRDPKFLKLTRPLAPAYLKFGGWPADYIVFNCDEVENEKVARNQNVKSGHKFAKISKLLQLKHDDTKTEAFGNGTPNKVWNASDSHSASFVEWFEAQDVNTIEQYLEHVKEKEQQAWCKAFHEKRLDNNYSSLIPEGTNPEEAAHDTPKINFKSSKIFNLSKSILKTILDFVLRQRFTFVYTLNLATVRLANGVEWDSENAKFLIHFVNQYVYEFVASRKNEKCKADGNKNESTNPIQVVWGLGNEPIAHLFKDDITLNITTGNQLAKDYAKLRELIDNVNEIYGPYVFNVLVGTEISQMKRKSFEFVKTLLVDNKSRIIDHVTWHHYYMSSVKAQPSNFVSPVTLYFYLLLYIENPESGQFYGQLNYTNSGLSNFAHPWYMYGIARIFV